MLDKIEKNKILLIYHSGSGSTRTIAEILSKKLADTYEVDLMEINPDFGYEKLLEYDLVILGYPTYYFKPSLSTLEFVEQIPESKEKKYFFLFTTYGLYSGNSIRALAKIMEKKEIELTGFLQVRGPASDGVLLLPSFLKFFFRYERKIGAKIDNIARNIKKNLKGSERSRKVPPPRWYSPFTGLFKKQIHSINYSTYRRNLKVLDERCNNCNICINNCIRNCWTKGISKPEINLELCEFCLKCVHNCPERAIIFSNKMKDSPRLDRSFYNKLKRDISL